MTAYLLEKEKLAAVILTRVNPTDKQKVEEIAKELGLSQSAYVRMVLRKELKNA